MFTLRKTLLTIDSLWRARFLRVNRPQLLSAGLARGDVILYVHASARVVTVCAWARACVCACAHLPFHILAGLGDGARVSQPGNNSASFTLYARVLIFIAGPCQIDTQNTLTTLDPSSVDIAFFQTCRRRHIEIQCYLIQPRSVQIPRCHLVCLRVPDSTGLDNWGFLAGRRQEASLCRLDNELISIAKKAEFRLDLFSY